MIEVKLVPEGIPLPYTVRFHGVSEELFDELVDEDTRAELIDGAMIVHSPATIEHDDLGGFLRTLMRLYAEERNLGKVLGPDSLVRLAPGRRFAPDVFFITQDRLPAALPKQWEGPPDLVIEVLSPSNRGVDLTDKRPVYQEAGVPEVWFVDPENKEIIVDRLEQGIYREEITGAGKVASRVLAGFWVNASWLWSSPLPRQLQCLNEILGDLPSG